MTPAQMIEALDAQLRASASSGSDGLKPYISDAALTLLDPRRELTEKDMASLKPEDRQIVLAYQRAFTMLGRSLGKSPEEDRQNLQIAADELLEQLRSGHKTLKLLNANLCTRVNGYGVFTPFKSNTFLAGQEQRAIVYAELENFKPRIDSDGLYEVSLTQQLVLYNQADGLPVWRIAPTEIIDRSRNRRRDFFIIQVVALPARLGVGKYNLKLTVTDQIGQAVDEVQIPINIVADAKLIDE
ncbi:MAG: hypothetical protein GC162_18260 [Planctomycetes bacterium]|nr:hypothetical protein [Planctomycetota bacterium]